MDADVRTEYLGTYHGYRLSIDWTIPPRDGPRRRSVCLGFRASSAPDPETLRDGEQVYFDTAPELRRAIDTLDRGIT